MQAQQTDWYRFPERRLKGPYCKESTRDGNDRNGKDYRQHEREYDVLPSEEGKYGHRQH